VSKWRPRCSRERLEGLTGEARQGRPRTISDQPVTSASRLNLERWFIELTQPVGFQNSATGVDLGFYAARSYSLMRPPSTGRALGPLLVEVGDGVIGAGWAELEAAMGAPCVVVGLAPASTVRR